MVTSSPEMHIALPKEQFVCVGDRLYLKNLAYRFSKRLLDLAVASAALILMGIPMVIIALLIKLESPGPVFYVHHRIGREGRDLPLYKFRSMVTNAAELFEAFTPEQKAEWEANFKLEHDPRITRIGKFLRRSSLDELPQLVNVLKGGADPGRGTVPVLRRPGKTGSAGAGAVLCPQKVIKSPSPVVLGRVILLLQ